MTEMRAVRETDGHNDNLKNEETASLEGNDLLFIDTLLLLNHNTTIIIICPRRMCKIRQADTVESTWSIPT